MYQNDERGILGHCASRAILAQPTTTSIGAAELLRDAACIGMVPHMPGARARTGKEGAGADLLPQRRSRSRSPARAWRAWRKSSKERTLSPPPTTPKPTPLAIPGMEDEQQECTPSAPPAPPRPPSTRTQKMFVFVPLQEVTMNGHNAALGGSTGQPPPKDDAQQPEKGDTENSKEHASKRSKIFFIQSPGRDVGSSYSDSHTSPDSDENADVRQGKPIPPAAQAVSQQPTADAPETPSPAPRPNGPVRTKSKRQMHPPTRTMKHTSAKTRVLGSGYQRPAPPPVVQRAGSEKKLANLPPTRRADSEPLPLQEKGRGTEELAQSQAQVAATKPVVPPGVGSPQVIRRREPEPAPAVRAIPSSSPAVLRAPPPTPASVMNTRPAVRGFPSSSPAVLRAPPPTPASVMNTRPPPAVSPSRLRVPPPTPVTVMQRSLPPPPPPAVAPTPQVARAPSHHTAHRSPPPPASPEDVDEDDDSEWFDSDAETDYEDPEAEAARQAELQRAAEEAKRQREMFSKRRTPSRVELVELGRIGGGLSRLFHPDPNVVESDLYRTQSATDASAKATMAERLKANKSAVELRPNPPAPASATASEARKHAAPLKLSRSTAALPTVQNQSVRAGESVTGSSTHGWLLKGKPEDEEESEEETEEPEDLGMSRSLAQQRLEAFASRSRSRTGSKRATPPTPLRSSTEPMQPTPPAPVEGRPPSRTSPVRSGSHHQVSFAPVETVEPENAPSQPIDFAPPHPYNQRIAQQNTPRTAARIMMADELSESVRRQLLWMRASRATGFPNNMPRVQSQDDVARNPPRVARALVDEDRRSAPQPGLRQGVVPVADSPRRRSAAGLRPLTPLQRNEQRQANALQRTRSLAEGLAHHDFHIAGW
ncbi:hypothetical protein CALVIDRAFT_524882 [Calocera viscosa TUFC12733]|uniref:DUF3295 domain-containing protein n=1 Tax=Calocera viscosa (strain TUFC12733) TaxID=1330018 RepID=A0A167R5X3_CALVF|nr:hypothetical protein CALVIDRAFT_524882 [Calocera viscosa TUFC12733]